MGEGLKPESGDMQSEKIPEKASDMELAIFLAGHIDNPCEVEVEPGDIRNIREFYIKRAEELLQDPKFTDPIARRFLENKIQQYSQ